MAEDRIVSALVENLLLVYPNGPPAEKDIIQQWLQEIVENDELTMTNRDAGRTCLYETALERAVNEWKLKSTENSTKRGPQKDGSKKVQKTSFSLFSQMDGGMWGPRITIEDLQGASTPEEKLALLQKVAHVDDLVMDWKEFLPIVREVLSDAGKEEYVNLHRKWFDQGRASTEHLPIRCDLCQNILDAIVNLVSSQWKDADKVQGEMFLEVHETIFGLWHLWFEMWMDLLQEPLGDDEATGSLASIGLQVLILMRDQDTGSATIYPAHFLALVDPTATWFQVWTTRLTPLVPVRMVQSSGLLPDLLRRASIQTGVVVAEDCKSRSQLMAVTLKQHSMSMMKAILACTRVQWFPSSLIWQEGETKPKQNNPLPIGSLASVVKETCGIGPGTAGTKNEQSTVDQLSECSGITQQQVGLLFELFFQVGTSIASSSRSRSVDSQPLTSICAEAIEIILLGAKHLEGSYDSLMEQCQGRTTAPERKGFDLLLSEVLEHLGS